MARLIGVREDDDAFRGRPVVGNHRNRFADHHHGDVGPLPVVLTGSVEHVHHRIPTFRLLGIAARQQHGKVLVDTKDFAVKVEVLYRNGENTRLVGRGILLFDLLRLQGEGSSQQKSCNNDNFFHINGFLLVLEQIPRVPSRGVPARKPVWKA